MEEAFIIMQIGNQQMDTLCDDVIVPAIQSAGLSPMRVDRDNQGDLLKAEIIGFIERAQIIIADLTNERPNCYLEVGYAMGLGKKRNLILTVREDHHQRSKNYKPTGNRIHFDLEGYDIIFWDPKDLSKFRKDLESRIKARLAIIEPSVPNEPGNHPVPKKPIFDEEWVGDQRQLARAGLSAIGRSGYMEASVALAPKGDWSQGNILSVVDESQIKTFGWPIGISLNGTPNKPKPTADGVRAEVKLVASGESALQRTSYDYWCFRRTGDFYTLMSLFEDERREETVFFDTRIVRTTELLLFIARCYARLEAPANAQVTITITHGGLRGRKLTAAGNRLMFEDRTSAEDTVSSTLTCSVEELDSKIVQNVRALLEPLFTMFDFFKVDEKVFDEIVTNFLQGRIS